MRVAPVIDDGWVTRRSPIETGFQDNTFCIAVTTGLAIFENCSSFYTCYDFPRYSLSCHSSVRVTAWIRVPKVEPS